jgi:hypothetical protein
MERGARRFVTDNSAYSGQDKRSCATTIATGGRSSGLRARDRLTKGKVMTAIPARPIFATASSS